MKLPNGKITSDYKEFEAAWRKILTPFKKLLNINTVTVYPDRGIFIQDPDFSRREDFVIPFWLVKKIIQLRPPLEKINPADEIYLHSIPVDFDDKTN